MEDYTIEQIRLLLSHNVLEVTFTKADGSERVMLASTNSMYIPKTESKAKKSVDRPPNDELVTVRDLTKKAWRSFRFDSLLRFVVTDYPVLQLQSEVAA